MSREVHRIGYHFPSIVVDQACMTLGVTLTASGRVMQSNFAFIDDQPADQRQVGRGVSKKKLKGKKRNASPSFDMTLSQAIIDTQAREAIKDLFPKVPPNDLHTIIGRAFQKVRKMLWIGEETNDPQGKGLVGTVGELSLVRRVQLAVTAHIRHEYTNYDNYLKSMQWADARKKVQQACLDLLVQWRGDDEDDGELEDILREVIVISDDEEDHEMPPDTGSRRGRNERSESVEFVSANDLNTQSVNYAAASSVIANARSPSLDVITMNALDHSDPASQIRNQPVEYTQHRLEQMGAHRHRIWEEAVNRQRRSSKTLVHGHGYLQLPSSNSFEQSRTGFAQEEQETRRPPHKYDHLDQILPSRSQDPRLVILPVSKPQFGQLRDDGSSKLTRSDAQVSCSSQAEVASIAQMREVSFANLWKGLTVDRIPKYPISISCVPRSLGASLQVSIIARDIKANCMILLATIVDRLQSVPNSKIQGL